MHASLAAAGIASPDAGTLASFLLPQIARRFVVRLAERGPEADDLPILLQFAPSHPDPDIHRALLAALTKLMKRHQILRFFAHYLYELDGPGRAPRRRLIREVLASYDASCLAPLWERSSTDEQLEILSLLESPRAHGHVPGLMKSLGLLRLRDPRLRARVTSLCARLPSRCTRAFLNTRLQDPDGRVRANAVEGLMARLSPGEAWEVLGPLSRDPVPRVQANAVLGLIRLGCRRGQDLLADMLSSDKMTIKASAAWVLRQLPKTGSQRAVRPSGTHPRPPRGPAVRFASTRGEGGPATTGGMRAVAPEPSGTGRQPAI